MRVPVWIKPAVWGAVIGAVGIMVRRLFLDGMERSGHTTTRLVAEGERIGRGRRAHSVFCVANYLKQPDAAKKLAVLREDGYPSSHTQRDIIEKAGFATMPGK